MDMASTNVRAFLPFDHIRNVFEAVELSVQDGAGTALPGIAGHAGPLARSHFGWQVGADRIVMQPGSAFPLHTHEGDHVLYVLDGVGVLHIDGVDHRLREGDAIYVPAEYPHGVKTYTQASGPFAFLAVGLPHKSVDATDRMRLA